MYGGLFHLNKINIMMNNSNTRSRWFAAALSLMMALPFMASAQTTAPLGILVSQDQNTIDWPTVNEGNDLDFVYVMATTGAAITDTRCAFNLTQAHKVGMPVGAVLRYDRHYSAQGQFDNFQAAVKGHHLDLPPVVYVVPDSPFDIKIMRLTQELLRLDSVPQGKPQKCRTVLRPVSVLEPSRLAGTHLQPSHDEGFHPRVNLFEHAVRCIIERVIHVKKPEFRRAENLAWNISMGIVLRHFLSCSQSFGG